MSRCIYTHAPCLTVLDNVAPASIVSALNIISDLSPVAFCDNCLSAMSRCICMHCLTLIPNIAPNVNGFALNTVFDLSPVTFVITV